MSFYLHVMSHWWAIRAIPSLSPKAWPDDPPAQSQTWIATGRSSGAVLLTGGLLFESSLTEPSLNYQTEQTTRIPNCASRV